MYLETLSLPVQKLVIIVSLNFVVGYEINGLGSLISPSSLG